MELQFLGAAQEVTGSMHLLTVNDKKILLDCGMVQGRRQEAFERNRDLPVDPKSLDALVLSHAHIDHSGNIPQLVKLGYEGNIFCTHATQDLCNVMLRDSAHIQEKDVEYVNKKHEKKGRHLPVWQCLLRIFYVSLRCLSCNRHCPSRAGHHVLRNKRESIR